RSVRESPSPGPVPAARASRQLRRAMWGAPATSAAGHGRSPVERIAGPTAQSGQRAGRGMRGMEHGQEDGEPIGTILSGIATLLRELSDQLDIAAARVEDSTDLDARLKKLESWALDAGQDITALQARMDRAESAEPRPAGAARPTRAERREAAERAELEAAASRNGSPATTDADTSAAVTGASDTTSASSGLVTLSGPRPDEPAPAVGTSTEAARTESDSPAPTPPARLAPVPRLPAPELDAAPRGDIAAPQDPEQGDASLAGDTPRPVPA